MIISNVQCIFGESSSRTMRMLSPRMYTYRAEGSSQYSVPYIKMGCSLRSRTTLLSTALSGAVRKNQATVMWNTEIARMSV
jgi:hypothetical protein